VDEQPTALPTNLGEFVSFRGWARFRVLTFRSPEAVSTLTRQPLAEPPLLPPMFAWRLLRPLKRAFGVGFRRSFKRSIDDFNDIEGLDNVDRDRMRPSIEASSEVVSRYDAWRNLPGRAFDFAIRPLLIAATIGWLMTVFLVSQTPLKAIAVVLCTIAGFALLFSVPLFLGVESDVAMLLWVLGLILAIGILLNGPLPSDSWPPTIVRSFNVFAVFVIGTLTVFSLLVLTERLFFLAVDNRKLRLLPEEEAISQLVFILAALRGDEEAEGSYASRRETVLRIDWLARVLEGRVHALRPEYRWALNPTTFGWANNVSREIAAAVRLYEREIVIPDPVRGVDVYAGIRRLLILACRGEWGCFERSEAEPVPSRRARLLRFTRAVVIIVFPLALVGVLAILPIELDSQLRNSLLTASIVWAVLATLEQIDPTAKDRFDSISKAVNPFQSRESK
jgi:hypothetical protein